MAWQGTSIPVSRRGEQPLDDDLSLINPPEGLANLPTGYDAVQ